MVKSRTCCSSAERHRQHPGRVECGHHPPPFSPFRVRLWGYVYRVNDICGICGMPAPGRHHKMMREQMVTIPATGESSSAPNYTRLLILLSKTPEVDRASGNSG